MRFFVSTVVFFFFFFFFFFFLADPKCQSTIKEKNSAYDCDRQIYEIVEGGLGSSGLC